MVKLIGKSGEENAFVLMDDRLGKFVAAFDV